MYTSILKFYYNLTCSANGAVFKSTQMTTNATKSMSSPFRRRCPCSSRRSHSPAAPAAAASHMMMMQAQLIGAPAARVGKPFSTGIMCAAKTKDKGRITLARSGAWAW